MGACDIVPEQVLGEAAKSGEARVSARSRILSLGFDIAQEAEYSFGLDILQTQFGYRPALPVSEEREKKLECIAISTDGMGAGSSDAFQIIVEKALYQSQQAVVS